MSSLLQTLVEEAKKVNNLRLSALAAKVRLDAFTKVKNPIHGSVAHLLKGRRMKSSTRTFCVEEFESNQVQLREKTDLIAKIEDLDHKEDPVN